MKLDLNGQPVYQFLFSENGPECETAGGKNVVWLYIDPDKNNASNLQYRPHVRGM